MFNIEKAVERIKRIPVPEATPDDIKYGKFAPWNNEYWYMGQTIEEIMAELEADEDDFRFFEDIVIERDNKNPYHTIRSRIMSDIRSHHLDIVTDQLYELFRDV